MVFSRIIILIFAFVIAGCSTSPEQKYRDDRSVFSIVSQADRAYTESRWLEAEKAYEIVIERVPQDHYGWFRLGNTQLHQGRIDSAIHTFQQAIKRNGDHPKTYYNLSIAYLLNALKAMEQADKSMRDNDPGKALVRAKMEQLLLVIGEPIENSVSPGRHHSTTNTGLQD